MEAGGRREMDFWGVGVCCGPRAGFWRRMTPPSSLFFASGVKPSPGPVRRVPALRSHLPLRACAFPPWSNFLPTSLSNLIPLPSPTCFHVSRPTYALLATASTNNNTPTQRQDIEPRRTWLSHVRTILAPLLSWPVPRPNSLACKSLSQP